MNIILLRLLYQRLIILLLALIALLTQQQQKVAQLPPQEPPALLAVCGNLICEKTETTLSCPQDCKKEEPKPVCGNKICESGETPASCPADCVTPPPPPPLPPSSSLLTYWGPYIDAIPDWEQKYVPAFQELKNIGFTHAGVHVWNENADVSAKIQGLRNMGYSIALHESTGHWFTIPRNFNNQTYLDGQTHPSNNQDLKYFDSTGFDPMVCQQNQWCDCKTNNQPDSHAIDPAYNGWVWQKDLARLPALLESVGIGKTSPSSDIVLIDSEVWGWNPTITELCYPGTLMNSTNRYKGATLNDRYWEYYNYWKQRGLEIKQAIKNKVPQTKVFFYNEQAPKIARGINEQGQQNWEWGSTTMPDGTGDAFSPSFYYAPKLSDFRAVLDRENFEGAIFYLSFSISTINGHWPPLYWDPLITQKTGFWLKQKKAGGVSVYPGPNDDGVPLDYYLAHARALKKGFVDGVDPGVLVEWCADNWDNDGDGEWDEADCQPKQPPPPPPPPPKSDKLVSFFSIAAQNLLALAVNALGWVADRLTPR